VNLQLSLTESEISKIGAIKVEGIINPTNAEMDLKDGVGEQDVCSRGALGLLPLTQHALR